MSSKTEIFLVRCGKYFCVWTVLLSARLHVGVRRYFRLSFPLQAVLIAAWKQTHMPVAIMPCDGLHVKGPCEVSRRQGRAACLVDSCLRFAGFHPGWRGSVG